MTKLVLDTSIVIDYLRNGGAGKEFFERKESKTHVLLPTVVFFELFSGTSTRRPHAVKTIEKFLKHFKRVQLTEVISKRAGELYRDVPHRLEIPDYIIAATALELDGVVVTLNKKHFTKIPKLHVYPLD